MATVEHCLFCFEALSASLEKRPPRSLYQVQASWSEYPKGLEQDTSDQAEEELDASEPATPNSSSTSSKPKKTLLSHFSLRSSSSSPSSSTPGSSSSSLSQTTAQTTPSSSSTYVPIGVHPHRSSQRSANITESPLFVTWNTIASSSSSHRSLRGCIGTFESLPLSTGLSSYALTSALSDHRFSPITLSELPSLEVSVTLLTDFENAKDAMDWELGVHGVRISFYHKGRRYGACYLPDVAVEQGWDKEETILSLMRKAGWGGRREKWRDVEDFKLVRFQGFVESVGWEEYSDWRKWEKEQGKRD